MHQQAVPLTPPFSTGEHKPGKTCNDIETRGVRHAQLPWVISICVLHHKNSRMILIIDKDDLSESTLDSQKLLLRCKALPRAWWWIVRLMFRRCLYHWVEFLFLVEACGWKQHIRQKLELSRRYPGYKGRESIFIWISILYIIMCNMHIKFRSLVIWNKCEYL